MNIIEEKYLERKTLTEELARQFNNIAIKKYSFVRLRVDSDGIGSSFELYYQVDDAFINNKIYADGHAVVYPAPAARDLIEALAVDMGNKVSWNNTATRGWLKF